MKQYFIKKAFIAGIAVLSVSAVFAQKEKDTDKGGVQQIIIDRKGAAGNEKTVIEINGDKVKVNGKELTGKTGDISVTIKKYRDMEALQQQGGQPRSGSRTFRGFGPEGDNLLQPDSNRAMLGVMTEKVEGGAQVKSVSEESAAAKAGIKEGDIIKKVNEAKIEDAEGLATEVRKHKPGEKITITLLRDGKEQQVTAELGRWKGVPMERNFRILDPEMFRGMPNLPNLPNMDFDFRGNVGGGAPKLGLSIKDTEDGKGVKVIDLDEEGNAARAGVKENDVITHVGDVAVNSVDEVSSQVRASRNKPSVTLKVLRNGKSQTIEVKTPKKLKTADL
ncbi:PDZ domain-containing protein [Paraflavisolibacter sp. H34]|uniref:PDZ domain-containing protein n=1 Tax=Huijunlia imazamoxiresistens TaxID=3127457 RepID=UPI003019CCB3